MARARWVADDLPDLGDRVVAVTGANSGIGYAAALALAKKGARVLMACRSQEKGRAALADLQAAAPGAKAELMALDLADLSSVRAFADAVRQTTDRLDALINNAGVMALPRRETADGFEMQIGTNHLGHFALTGALLELLAATGDPQRPARVVTVASIAHRWGWMRFDDLHGRARYWRWQAYGQSKLANLLFAFELQRRLDAAGLPVASVACHPGYSSTALSAGATRAGSSSIQEWIIGVGNGLFAQSAEMGALPTLYAAFDPGAAGGDYIGPDRWFEIVGHPKKVGCSGRARDAGAAARLWRISAEATGAMKRGLGS